MNSRSVTSVRSVTDAIVVIAFFAGLSNCITAQADQGLGANTAGAATAKQACSQPFVGREHWRVSVASFLEGGGDPSHWCNDVENLLMIASNYMDAEITMLLLNKGANLNKKNGLGDSAPTWAARSRRFEVLQAMAASPHMSSATAKEALEILSRLRVASNQMQSGSHYAVANCLLEAAQQGAARDASFAGCATLGPSGRP